MNFDDFWNIYPRKVGKISARTMWDKCLRAGYDPADIVKGAKAYAKQITGTDPQYIKHPDGWLRAGRWMDELPVPIDLATFRANLEAERKAREDARAWRERILNPRQVQ